MTTETLYPTALNGALPSLGSYSTVGGTIPQVLADNDDATYVMPLSTDLKQRGLLFPAWSANEVPWRIRIHARIKWVSDGGGLPYALISTGPEGNFYAALAPAGTITTRTTSWTTSSTFVMNHWDVGLLKAHNNGPYRAAALYDASSSVEQSSIWYRFGLELETTPRPSAGTVTVSPSSPVTTTTRPTIGWTYSDGDSWAQTRYRVKVYSSDQYSAGGFNPRTTVPLQDSGWVSSAAASWQLASPLENGTYRAYVWVSKTTPNGHFIDSVPSSTDPAVGGTAAPSHVQWTQNTPPPPSPVVSGVWSQQWQMATVRTATNNTWDDTDVAGHVVEWEKLVNGTWTRVASFLVGAATQVTELDQWHVHRGKSNTWRARSVTTLTGGSVRASDWATVVVDCVSDHDWWIRRVGEAGVKGVKVAQDVATRIEENSQVFHPLGSANAVVVAGELQAEAGTFEIQCTTWTEWRDVIRPLVERQEPLWIMDPLDECRWVRIVGRAIVSRATSGFALTRATVEWVSVDAPSV